tara:strand:+ start:8835 stop:11207 length:2373 start_codon:yes stop_codon:yes gene_type:complete
MDNNDGLNLKELIGTYLKHWIWFVLCVIIAIAIAFFKIRYSIPEYQANARIQIIEEKGASPELSVFQDLDIFSGTKNKVEDEIQILTSRSNFIEVVEDLKLNITIQEIGNLRNLEFYNKSIPFKLNFMVSDSILRKSSTNFYITVSSETTFGYAKNENSAKKVNSFGKKLDTDIGGIIITPNDLNVSLLKGKTYQISIGRIERVAVGYQKKLIAAVSEKESSILDISLTDPIEERATDVISNLIRVYNEHSIAEKKAVADKTADFINKRIVDISTSLSSVDQNAQDFKSGKGITDIASEANINLNVGARTSQELENAKLQLDIAESMKEIVQSQDSYNELPSNIGLSDPSITNTTSKYNEIVAERNRLLKSSNEKNPIIVSLNQQLSALKSTMESSLNGMTNNLSLQVNNLSQQKNQISSRLYAAPKNERALRDITRKQETTESLYLYLLQKREESQITYASATPKSKIIDEAHLASNRPVSPRIPLIYMASIILGLLLPFSIIYIYDLLDDKIHNKIGVEKISKNIPVLAEIPKLGKREPKLISENDRSVLAESLRIFRTNLDYIIKSKKDNRLKNNLIFITSSVSGEGKTFLASNLAMIFANTGKKTLLIGADIRNPKLYTFFNNNIIDKTGKTSRGNARGLTEYLYDHDTKLSSIIETISVNSNRIDLIYSGKIPPNPSELLMSDRMKTLFDEVSSEYDYVIVDTAPMMVVTDSLLISHFADQIIYVTRAGVTEKKVLQFPLNLVKEGKLKGLSFVVNDVKSSNLGYGGKYGYGYNVATKKWWKFWA